MAKQTIVNADCVSWMRDQPDHSIDIIVTSPPYNKNISYNTYADQRSDYLQWMAVVFTECCRILKTSGHLFLNIAGSAKNPFLPYAVAEQVPWVVQNHFVWAKAIEFKGHIYGRSTVNINARYRLPNGHETVWHFTHAGKTEIDVAATAVNYRPEFAQDNFQRTGRRTRPTTTCWHIPYETTGYMGQASSKVKGPKGHPAIFPRELVRRCIKLAGSSGMIYDPFAGTGTTLLVAKEMQLDCVGTEIDKDYCKFIKERLK